MAVEKTGKGTRDVIYIAIIVVLLAVILLVYAGTSFTTTSQSAAVEKVKNVYSLLTENPVDVVSVKDDAGIYRILMKTTLQNGQQQLTEVLATKDGSLFTDKIINTTGYAQLLESQKSFVQCLSDKQIVIVGLSTDTNTVAQLQTLGNFAYKIYLDCSGQNLAVCQQANITTVPTIVVGNVKVPGPQPLSFFLQNFNCTM